MRVKDSWSEAGHPNQNPVEQGGIRILKQGVDGLLTRKGVPPEPWSWVYSCISYTNNHCVSKYLNWRTPIEK